MHPAMFPTSLTDKLVQTYTETGDLVLDPFVGSGQTGLSCLKYDRKFVGFDLSEEYVDLAKKRMNLAKNPGDRKNPA